MDSTWDDLKRVREEEHFIKEETQKLKSLKADIHAKETQKEDDKNVFSSFQKGSSALTGSPLYKMTVAGETVIDCPEEKSITMSYHTLQEIIECLQDGNASAINAWKAFIKEHEETTDEKLQ